MDRKTFREYFESQNEDGYARFDRSGMAEIGCAWPKPKDAKALIQYDQVRTLNLGVHRDYYPVESLRLLLSGWSTTLEQLQIQDYRYHVTRARRCRSLNECVTELGQLHTLWSLKLDGMATPKAVVIAIAELPGLTHLVIEDGELTLSAFKELQRSQSLEDVYVCACSGVYSEDVEGLDPAFRKRCRVAVFK